MGELPESKPLSFEEAYSRLDSIVKALDAGRGGLEEALASYEQGMILLKICREKLEGASRKIEQLKGVDEQGNPVLEALKEEELKSQADAAGRQSASSYAETQNTSLAKVETSMRKPVSVRRRDAQSELFPGNCSLLTESEKSSGGPQSEPKRSGSRQTKRKEPPQDCSLLEPPF